MVETLVSDIPDDLPESIFQVLDRACELERTLAAAESCTGGLVASLFTDVEGSSHAFERGYVVRLNNSLRRQQRQFLEGDPLRTRRERCRSGGQKEP